MNIYHNDCAADRSADERNRSEPPTNTCIHALFEEQARRTPERTAVTFNGQGLSYQALDLKATSLAHRLRSFGAGPEVLVGVCAERSLDVFVAILAILKAGAAYVPLDPAYPKARLAFMLEDADTRVLLTQRSLQHQLPPCQCDVIYLDDEPTVGSDAGSAPPLVHVSADDLAYVIYTSGSTGKPKGVAVTHRPLCNLTRWHLSQPELGRAARTLQLASLSFDVSVQEMFSTWCAGGTLVLISENTRRDPTALLECILRESIERIFLPFSSLQQLAVAATQKRMFPGSLREIVTAGEQLRITPEIVSWLQALAGCNLYNQYGPTETHVVITSHALRGAPERWPALPPLGRPIANVRIYILDEQRRPAGNGVPGEIYVGGTCLARGYLNRPELTAERFVPDPFGEEPNGRLYRTGDLARALPDGDIEFLGRLDDQVKVRGFRIELGEIEAALDQHPKIRQAAVVVREDVPGDRRLVAYLATDDPGLAVGELRRFVAERVPEYMLPSTFVTLEALATTPSGKVDRQALPAPANCRSVLGQNYVPPRCPVEERLAAIWAEALEQEPIGTADNFFELGGDSLRATRVLARVETAFGVRFPHQWLFESPTVAGMASRLHGMRQGVPPTPIPTARASSQEGVYPLSFGQEQIWVAAQLHPDLPLYNEPFAIHIPQTVDVQAMDTALNALIVRHEILRTGFLLKDGHPVQIVHSRVQLRTQYFDFREVPAVRRAAEATERFEVEAQRPFDLSRPPLARAVLAQLGECEHRLCLIIHHIVIDAVSVYEVLLPELFALYRSALQMPDAPMQEPLPLQYADFATWQRSSLQSEALEEHLRYWEKRLADAPALDLPSDRSRPAVPSRRGAFEPFTIAPKLSVQLDKLARERGATLYMVLLAAFLTVLWRYTRQNDFVVGTVDAGRGRPELEPLLGYFLNTLMIRADLSGDPPFLELLQRVRAWVLDAHAHKDYSFTELIERLATRHRADGGLFRVACVMEPSLPAQESGWTVSQLEVQTATAKFDLTLELEMRSGIIGRFEYATDLFDTERIRRLIGHFATLLESVAAGPNRRLSELQLLSAAEQSQLLVEWNHTRREYPRDQCIHSLFAAQAARSPEVVAVVQGDRRLRYGTLDMRANRLAHLLRRMGVAANVPVGVYGERSIETLTALLAVLKAGGAYVPLDPGYPPARLEFMLKDSGARVLLAQQGLPHMAFDGPVVLLEPDLSCAAAESTASPAVQANAEHLAYVMYTSGSTGTPKGVAVPHRAVVRLLFGVDYAQFGADQVCLLMAPLAFDASTFELWGALLHGGRCVVFPNRVPDIRALGRTIAEHRVSSLWLTAALFNAIIDEAPEILAPVRQVLTGGEALSPSHVRRALACLPETRLINGYGPTEGTTFTCCYAIPRRLVARESSVPIGRPIANTRVYVLDEYQNPMPVGVPGELYIGGDGLARSYLNRPELTAERFVPSPFDSGERLYRTGDRVCYMPDGNLSFLGRLDDQIKVRGFRIEPGEIEVTLTAHPAVREAVVVARGEREKRLVAYVVADPDTPPALEELREVLHAQLPDYMVPSAFVFLESLPLTDNGKVDRDALPPDGTEQPGVRFSGPRNAVEVQLVKIWESILGRFPVGIRDDFFALGGSSLMALQMVDRIRQLFTCELHVDVLWHQGRTIEGLAALVEENGGESIWSAAVPVNAKGTRRPLFCPHVAGGHIYQYSNLSRHLDSDQPVYGLPARGTDGRQRPDDTIEALAAHSIRLMRGVQPHGPYALLGYCSGGVIAFEMARQLEDQGEEVALLALVDSLAPGRHVRLWVSLIADLIKGRNLRLVQEWIYHRLLHPTGLRKLRQLSGLGEAHRWALWSYLPRSYAGQALVLKPNEYQYSRDPALGWARLVEGGLQVRTLPGRHGDLFKEPGVRALAAELQKWLA